MREITDEKVLLKVDSIGSDSRMESVDIPVPVSLLMETYVQHRLFCEQATEAQRQRVTALEDCIRELLKGGKHEGECGNDYDGDSGGPCFKHVEASNQREAAARKLLGESNGT
jgi:hypothetical protein